MKCVREGYINGYYGSDAIKVVRIDECQKDYVCKKCNADIAKGSPYFSYTHKVRNWVFYSEKICIECGKETYANHIWVKKRV